MLPPTHKPAVITNPDWVRVPSAEELMEFYPHNSDSSGFVRMECDVTAAGLVTGCVIASENPTGHGFGKSALAMAKLFRMKPQTEDGVPVGGGVVTIPLNFTYSLGPQAPQWAQKPTPEELLSVWPQGAPDTGGEATIDCIVTPKAVVKECSRVSETPDRSGFAAAAIRLSPKFKLKPAEIDGHPYASNVDVRLTVSFTKPQPQQTGAGEFGGVTALHNAPWSVVPSTAEMAAAWPGKAPPTLEVGRARVECRFSPDTALTGCKLLSEDPAGYGFGAAAVKLTDRFRTRGAIMEDALLAKARIFLSFAFDNPKLDASGPTWVTNPNWVSFIPADRMTQLYPTGAADAGIKSGRGVVDCTVAPDGALTGCAISGEDPPGRGFGPAALAAISSFAVNPWTDDGRPVEGQRIRVPIRFVESEPAASAEPQGAPTSPGGAGSKP